MQVPAHDCELYHSAINVLNTQCLVQASATLRHAIIITRWAECSGSVCQSMCWVFSIVLQVHGTRFCCINCINGFQDCVGQCATGRVCKVGSSLIIGLLSAVQHRQQLQGSRGCSRADCVGKTHEATQAAGPQNIDEHRRGASVAAT